MFPFRVAPVVRPRGHFDMPQHPRRLNPGLRHSLCAIVASSVVLLGQATHGAGCGGARLDFSDQTTGFLGSSIEVELHQDDRQLPVAVAGILNLGTNRTNLTTTTTTRRRPTFMTSKSPTSPTANATQGHPMTTHPPDRFALVTTARVARTRWLVIDEGDGPPSTHTQPTAGQHWTVTPGVRARAPLPFTAKQPPRRSALVPWWSLLLSTVALAVIGAAIGVGVVAAAIGAGCVVAMGFCCLVLVIAELVHRADAVRNDHGPRPAPARPGSHTVGGLGSALPVTPAPRRGAGRGRSPEPGPHSTGLPLGNTEKLLHPEPSDGEVPR